MISRRVVRFVTVGVSNALIDFCILNFAFYFLHTNRILSSILATMFAMTYSFVLNRRFVFKSSAKMYGEVLAFVAVTVIGILIIHNSVYALSLYIFDHNPVLISLASSIFAHKLSDSFITINASTVVGALVALVWNYNGYRLFVFKEVRKSDEEAEV